MDRPSVRANARAGNELEIAWPTIVSLTEELAGHLVDGDASMPAGGTHPYARAVLCSRPDLEVMVATWRPGAACLPHDHGAAKGHVRILQGSFEHTVYRSAPGADLQPARPTMHEQGDRLPVGPGLIHAMTCTSERPAVTMHWYRPRITGMRVFTPSLDSYWIVSDDCGAWEPEAHQIVTFVGDLAEGLSA